MHTKLSKLHKTLSAFLPTRELLTSVLDVNHLRCQTDIKAQHTVVEAHLLAMSDAMLHAITGTSTTCPMQDPTADRATHTHILTTLSRAATAQVVHHVVYTKLFHHPGHGTTLVDHCLATSRKV
jgi:hypothetical protein